MTESGTDTFTVSDYVADHIARMLLALSDVSEGNFDYAVVADFDNADSWLVYRDNPEHQRIATEMIRPLVAERAAVQSSGHG